MSVFDRGEFLSRLQNAKSEMQDRGLDVLLVCDPCNIYYLSGYDAWSFYSPQALIVTLEEEEPLLVCRHMDRIGARQTCFMGEDRITPYPDQLIQNPPHHPAHFFADFIQSKGWAGKKIGVELDNYYYSARMHLELAERLPNAEFIDAGLLVNWLRVLKSAREITYIKQAGEIVERAMAEALDAINVGVRQCDVAAKIYHAQISGTEQFGGAYTTTPPLMPSGERVSAPHLSWTDAPFEAGTSTNIEIGACRYRYHAPLSRTVYLGDPPEKFKTFENGLLEGLDATLDAVKPGVVCAELHEIWRNAVSPFGIEKESRIGYSVGIGYPPTWGELSASIRPDDKTVLQPGMVFHLMPGIWDEGLGMVITETFVVTEDGHETLSHLPRQVTVKN